MVCLVLENNLALVYLEYFPYNNYKLDNISHHLFFYRMMDRSSYRYLPSEFTLTVVTVPLLADITACKTK